ncbi:MAG: ROK family protein [Armatimonadota bacterium]|nr:ROK family protein [Armatimonadota bacterium]
MTQQTNGKYLIGVDLGGTNVRAAVSDKTGRLLGDAREPSYAMSGFDITAGQIIKSIRGAMAAAGVSDSQLAGIGMGVPGTIKPKQGIVVWTPNFHEDWANANVVDPIRGDFGAPVFIGNDANVAALGEYWFGAGQGVNSLMMFTLGTGIGTGLVMDGKLWVGESEGATEFGHQVILADGPRCGCGRYGCLEALAGRTAIINRAQRKLHQGRDSLLLGMVNNEFPAITPALIAEAAGKGDAVSVETLAETGYYIGLGVANVITGLSVAMVVIGGGVSGAGDALWQPMMRTISANTLVQYLEVCGIVPSRLGDDVGIMGGIGLAMQEAAPNNRQPTTVNHQPT